MFDFGEKKRKRTLGIRDKQILHQKAKYKCEACGKKVKFSEMQVGHKKAYSKKCSYSDFVEVTNNL